MHVILKVEIAVQVLLTHFRRHCTEMANARLFCMLEMQEIHFAITSVTVLDLMQSFVDKKFNVLQPKHSAIFGRPQGLFLALSYCLPSIWSHYTLSRSSYVNLLAPLRHGPNRQTSATLMMNHIRTLYNSLWLRLRTRISLSLTKRNNFRFYIKSLVDGCCVYKFEILPV